MLQLQDSTAMLKRKPHHHHYDQLPLIETDAQTWIKCRMAIASSLNRFAATLLFAVESPQLDFDNAVLFTRQSDLCLDLG